MQIWITDRDFTKSARNLDHKRLFSNIYESIHILASIYGLHDQLVTPKRDVSNTPQAKLWRGYESMLLAYIYIHINEWRKRGYRTTTNIDNVAMLEAKTKLLLNPTIPRWATDELIETHRSVLIEKKPDYYKSLWPSVTMGLQMRYDWRDILNGK